jgi:hypothetical protein
VNQLAYTIRIYGFMKQYNYIIIHARMDGLNTWIEHKNHIDRFRKGFFSFFLNKEKENMNGR